MAAGDHRNLAEFLIEQVNRDAKTSWHLQVQRKALSVIHEVAQGVRLEWSSAHRLSQVTFGSETDRGRTSFPHMAAACTAGKHVVDYSEDRQK